MDELRWLRDLFGTVRCASCNSPYGTDGIAVLGRRGDNWFLRCSCPACGTQALGAVVVREVNGVEHVASESTGEPAMSDEDVFNAHELLQQYRGDALGLFDGGNRVSGR